MKPLPTALFFLGVTQAGVQACSTCFGDPNSSMSKGATIGMLVLLFIVGMVLGAIGAFIYYLYRKSKQIVINGPEDLGIRLIKEVRNVHE